MLVCAEKTRTAKGRNLHHASILGQICSSENSLKVEIGKILLSYQKVPRLNSIFTPLYFF